jgi:hypothetical protein
MELRFSKLGILGAASGLALLASSGVALAKSRTQVIQLAPGVKLVISQDMTKPVVMPIPPVSNPLDFMRQISQTLAVQQMLMQDSFMPIALPPIPHGASSVIVTSFNDGKGSCTQRIVYPANGDAPQVQTRTVGDVCQAAGFTPAALPRATVPSSPISQPGLVLADDKD